MADDKLYCPEFVFQILCGQTVHDFLTKEFTLDMIATQYSKAAFDHYKEIKDVEFTYAAEGIVRFISDQKNPLFEPIDKVNGFIHDSLKFDGLKGKRKLKGIFGNAFTGDKERKYDAEKTVADFRAFVFALRAGNVKQAPPGWSLKDEEELFQLGEIITKDLSINDII